MNEGRIGPGIGFAAELLDPDWVIEKIHRSPAIDAFEVVDRERDDNLMDEGAIRLWGMLPAQITGAGGSQRSR